MATGNDDDNLSHSVLNATDEYFDLYCTPCSTRNLSKEVVKYCTNCKEYICIDCVNTHNSFKILSKHVLVDPTATQYSSSQSGGHVQYLPTELCKRHPHELINMYCAVEDKVGCSVCFNLDHRSCDDVHYVPDYITSNYPNGQVKQITNELIQAIKDMNKLKNQHDRLDENLDKSKATCKQEIQKYRTEINQIIDKIEASTLTELDSKHRDMKQMKVDANQNIHDVYDEMIRFKFEIESDQSNIAQKFVIAKLSQSLITQGRKLQSELPNDLTTKLAFTRNTDIMTFLVSIITFGILSPSVIQDSCFLTATTNNQRPQQTQSTSTSAASTNNQQPLKTYATSPSAATTNSQQPQQTQSTSPSAATTNSQHPKQTQSTSLSAAYTGSQQPPQTRSTSPSESGDKRDNTTISEGRQQDTKVGNKPLEQCLYNIVNQSQYNIKQDDEIKCGIWSSCIIDKGNILLVDNRNNKLKLINSRTYTIEASMKLNAEPRSVCRVNSTEAAVCLDNDTIQFVSTRDDILTSLRSLSMTHECTCIAVCKDNMYVGTKTSVRVYTLSGKHVKTIGTKSGIFSLFSDRNDIFSDITDIAVSDDENMIHLADYNNGVITLNAAGDVVWTYSGSELHAALGVCTDGTGNVFVCGVWSDNVIQLAPGGKYMGQIVTRSDSLSYPRSVCCDRDNHTLIVGCGLSNEITVYNVQ